MVSWILRCNSDSKTDKVLRKLHAFGPVLPMPPAPGTTKTEKPVVKTVVIECRPGLGQGPAASISRSLKALKRLSYKGLSCLCKMNLGSLRPSRLFKEGIEVDLPKDEH